MHTKKGARGGNPIENILGTSGTSAAADGVAELKRFGNKGKLTVVGRTIPHENFDLVWLDGPEGWGWTIESQGDGTMGETSEDVVAFLEAQGPTKPAAIAAMLHKSYGAIWMALQRLQDRGRVIRLNDKRWELVRKRQ
jgi:biotin operon repressor